MRPLATLLLAACLAAIAAATIGGDISSSVSKGTFDCCKKQGWDLVATRSYCSYGAPDPQAPANLDAAKAAGIATRDVYHFPCRGGDAAAQVKDDVDHVGKHRFGTLWFDIETNPSPNCGWSSDLASNCKFLGDMIDAGHKMGIKMGVYSSQYMWSSIMGSCTTGADHGLPLWYAHYDGSQSFSDFSPFGGWTSPYLKQYWDSVSYCGISADADWRP